MSARSAKAGAAKLVEKREKLKSDLWGDELDTLKIWNRKKHTGFTTIPRVMPQLNRIMDKRSGKGKPLTSTYLSLWCNVFDEGFIEIKEKTRFAFESGFSGERAVTTWTNRMRTLEDLGFISSKAGANGEFSYVLILNPLNAVSDLYDDHVKDELYNALIGRMNDVGAKFDE
jgi:hypothetical protein